LSSTLGAQQSSALANFDTFFIFTVVAVALIVLVFLHETLFRGKKRSRRGRMKGGTYAA
jgi:hypothetical protein